ncbi:MAG: response regulator [Burkholderiaceae bacterium]
MSAIGPPLTPAQWQNRALVVDDVAAERERMSGILRGAGWDVRLAASGAQAIERARSERPAIIFMDIVMPDMDGFEACRRLAQHRDTRAIPVVFVSTKSQRADRVWARMQGGRDLIGKPYTVTQLLDALRHAR